MDSKLSGVLDMLEEAAIQLSEASDELRHYHDRHGSRSEPSV